MEFRKLGTSGINVAPLAFGGNVFGWTVDESTSFALLDAFVDAGFNLIDTADVYSAWAPGHSGGESETIIGKWMKARGNREKVVVATKVGMEMGPGKKGLSKSYIAEAAEASLRRLQTDYIDVYQSHRDDEETPQLETLEAYAELIKAGKVRTIGASNFSAERLASALAISKETGLPTYATLQPLYNLYNREEFERYLAAVCLEHNVGVIPYYALAAGFLTGKYRTEADLTKSPRGSSAKRYLNDRGLKILAALDDVAASIGSTPGKVAVAWLMSRPAITAPIASATNLEQLHDLIDATKLTLDEAAIETLGDASSWP